MDVSNGSYMLNQCDEMTNKLVLCSIGVDSNALSLVHFRGRICDESYINVNEDMERQPIAINILFDTGALSANYISERLVNDIKYWLPPEHIKSQRNVISLADDSRIIQSNEVVQLDIAVSCDEGKETKINDTFVVIQMKDNDIILGLPTILNKLWVFFKTSIEKRKDINKDISSNNSMNKLLASALLPPWTTPTQEDAPEEKEVSLPVQFEFATTFMGKTRSEAEQEYYDLMETHVSKDFKDQTNIINLLKTKAMKAFLPDNWEGIKGIPELRIQFKEDMPARIKPKPRPINPRLWECAVKEFERLKGYFYEPSRSPWASCLVIAPKATKPFIRFCGDYSGLNRWIPTGHFNIPVIKHELDRIAGHTVFADVDLTNAFHQVPLHNETRERLSIQTPWGQYQPKFMPEGIGPGSAVLQETVRTLFSDFDWAITIFDNVLILGKDFPDLYQKFETFIDRCLEHNVVLKFAKTWLGFKEVEFFGYRCKNNSIELTDDRKKAILDIPFPSSGNRAKKIRSLLGCGVMFVPFIPNYSDLTKNLTDMTKPNFNWDQPETWKHDYKQQFEDYKLGLQKACAIFYPNYELPWILRTDASDYGAGAVLIQVDKEEGGKDLLQPIAFWSQKFSEQALKWPTIEKEGYAIYAAVKKFNYYLVGKHFVIETDHNNLRWMEASTVPKIMRWHIYLRAFNFEINHISGNQNTLADGLSRLLLMNHVPKYSKVDQSDKLLDTIKDLLFQKQSQKYYSNLQKNILSSVFDESDVLDNDNEEAKEIEAMPDLEINYQNDNAELRLINQSKLFREIHNAKVGHMGLKESWKRLNKHFPGHSLSMQYISQLISECSTCQKTRKERRDKLVPVTRTLKPAHSRSAIGIDALQMTPRGSKGETHIIVIVNLFTKHVFLFPVVGCTAVNLALAVWTYWCNFGVTDHIISDQGPDLTSALFRELVHLSGVRHQFSIANCHANGVERLIKEVSRHLRALVYDNRVANAFDDPTFIPSVQYILNSHVSSETAHSPFDLLFGSEASKYQDLFDKKNNREPTHLWLQRLDANLKLLNEASAKYQNDLVKSRQDQDELVTANTFQIGDYVTFDSGSKVFPKMSCRFKGPFRVESQIKNDVTVRNLVTDALVTYSVKDLEPFYSSNAEVAYQAALRDQEQFVVKRVISYRGDCNKRSACYFILEFEDGDIRELPWSKDIECEAYCEFCKQYPYLYHFTLDTNMAKQFKVTLNRQNITNVQPGDVVFLDLRFFGDQWYESQNLPDWQISIYPLVSSDVN